MFSFSFQSKDFFKQSSILTENKSIGYFFFNSSNSSYNSNFESLSYKCDYFLLTKSLILFNNSSSTSLLGVGF